MNETHTIITPTCDRPEAFALCEKYVARQTVQPLQWFVLDDSKDPVKTTMGQTVIRTLTTRGNRSLVFKMKNLFDEPGQILGEVVSIIEDDDWYSPEYLETVLKRIADQDVIGEGHALYYNVQARCWYCHTNMQHASLCATSFRRSAFPCFSRQLWTTDPFIDTRFWRTMFPELRRKIFNPNESKRTTVGMKGLPGIKGYGRAHDHHHVELKAATRDLDLSTLRKFIGNDAEAYTDFVDPARL